MSVENVVMQQVMEEMAEARKSHLRSIRQIWASKETLSEALKLKAEFESQGMSADVSAALMSICRVSLTVHLNTDHSVTRDVLPTLEDYLDKYELITTNKYSFRGEVELKYIKKLSEDRNVTLYVSILTAKSSACIWVGTGRYVEIQDLICDEQPAA